MKENKIKRSFLMKITAAMKAANWDLKTVALQLLQLEKLALQIKKTGWLSAAAKLNNYILSLKLSKCVGL